MTNEQRPTPWWQTLPGLLTATAAIITAATGLVVALNQTGLLARHPKPVGLEAASDSGTVRALKSADPPAGSTKAAAPRPAGDVPWVDKKAVVAFKDGTTLTLDAPTFRICISVGDEINVNGLYRKFSEMRSLEVKSANDPYASGAMATVRVTLTDGTVIDGKIEAVCRMFGSSGEHRSRDFHFNEVTRIDFR